MEIRNVYRPPLAAVAGVLVIALTAMPAAAQQTQAPSKPWYVNVSHYGKWVALASAIGLTTMAAIRHDDANKLFRGLNALCSSSSSNCTLSNAGTYDNNDAELLFQETKRLDGQANRFLQGGQITLLASGVMFLIDLVVDESKPKNIPFTRLKVYNAPNRIGLGFEF